MSIHPIPSVPTQPPSAADRHDQNAEDAQYYRGILHGMIDTGAALVGQIGRAAQANGGRAAQADGEVPSAGLGPEAAADYERITRSVRRSIVLARRLFEVRPVQVAPGVRRAAARQQIIRAVEDRITWSARNEDTEALEDELYERLDGPDLDDAIDSRPIDEIITEICHDLDLGAQPGRNPWKRRTPDDIAMLCARAAGLADVVAEVTDPAPQPCLDLWDSVDSPAMPGVVAPLQDARWRGS